MRQRGVVGAVDVLRDPHAPEDHGGPGAGVEPRHRAEGLGFNAADLRHGLGRELRHVPFQLLESVGVGCHVVAVVEPFGDDDVEQRVEQRHVGAGLELKHPGGVAPQGLAARIHHDEMGAAFGGLLEVGGRHRMILRGVGADGDDDVRVLAGGEGRGHGGGADALHQGRHRRRVAKAGAVVHVVGAEARAHELLHQVRFLVGALGGAVTRQRITAVPIPYLPQARGRCIQRLLPGGLAEMAVGVCRIHFHGGILGRVVPANQRHGEAMRVADVVEAKAPLDAQASAIGWSVAALHRDDGVVLDPVADLATHAAIRADAGHLGRGARACPPRPHPPGSRASGRRWDTPARTRRRPRRCCRPWGRRSRRRSWRRRPGGPCR